MRRQIEHKLENAILVGVIVLLVVGLVFFMGRDINTRAVYNYNKGNLSEKGAGGLSLMVIVSVAAILFVLFAMDYLILRMKFDRRRSEIKEFVDKCLERRYSIEESVGFLTKNGFDFKDIEGYLS